MAMSLLAAGTAAGAQQAPPTCGGLDATIVVVEVEDPVGPTFSRPPIVGTDGPDVIVVQGIGDFSWVDGLGGDDTICTTNVGVVWGGAGNDTIFVEGGEDVVRLVVEGGEGDDTIHGDDQTTDFDDASGHIELLVGDEGDDTIYGNDGADVIYGMDGNDTIHGNAGLDSISGGGGVDVIYGGWGNDAIYGGDFSGQAVSLNEVPSETPDAGDEIFGGPGSDYLVGGLGFDQLSGGTGDDLLFANVEQDLASVDDATPADEVDTAGSRMFGGAGDDVLVGSNRWDRMLGGLGDDTLWGFEGRDYIRGGQGNDTIVGGPGIDDINGNTGNDHLIYQGRDIMRGGWGIDRCEAATWPATLQNDDPFAHFSLQPDVATCERFGQPTLVTPLASYQEAISS